MIDRIGNRQPTRTFIREWMEYRHIDSKRLAERMDRAEATVSKLLSGKMKMTLEYLHEFAHALNTPNGLPDLFRDPATPTREELLRGYSIEEISTAIQLVQTARNRSARSSSGMLALDVEDEGADEFKAERKEPSPRRK